MSTTEAYAPENLQKWTMPNSYFGATWEGYYSSGCGQSRDSDALERSNFACMLAQIGGESDTVIVVRENHFLVGWVEWIAIADTDETALRIADEIQEKLADYPVINEEHLSAEEDEEANEIWANCYGPNERLDYIRAHRSQFDFRDFEEMLGCVRGHWFSGYASELCAR